MTQFHQLLKEHWGYDDFRPLQLEIIESLFEGRDTLGLMPTGGGKSLTFQVPALAMEGVCLVVTPLIALMRDQVANLRARHLKASTIYSGMTPEEIGIVLDNAIYGGVKYLYVSPERLTSPLFLAKFQAMKVAMIVVDEAHCISQWGYDFRPAYLTIADIRPLHPNAPLLALTATATPEVVADIQQRLAFRTPNVFRKSFFRPNIAYVVRPSVCKEEELLHIIRRTNGCTIVYTRNRKRTQEMAAYLERAGISASFFHAGLKKEIKEQRQDGWKRGEIQVIVATNAFGMGIDKADVRLVVHLDMPDTPEEYFQEAGRAGRDELKAYAVALYGPQDQANLRRRFTNAFPEREFIKDIYEKVGSFLQIPVGEGFEVCREFNFDLFCKRYKLAAIPTFSALKLLELSGWLLFIPEEESQSRILFLLQRDELYRLRGHDPLTERVINALLRGYTGLFTDYAYLDDEKLTKQLGITLEQLYLCLVTLTRQGIVNYVPRKKVPYIIYPQRREDKPHVQIPRSVYEERKERYEARVNSIIDYLNNTDRCRSQLLLDYFKEANTSPCGICDICLKLKRDTTSSAALNHSILELLQQGSMTKEELLKQLNLPRDLSLEAIRQLLDRGVITIDGELLSIVGVHNVDNINANGRT